MQYEASSRGGDERGMSAILGFTTYPVVLPRHGGQKRIAAFRDFYRQHGFDYVAASLYEPGAYPREVTSPADFPFAYGVGARPGIPATSDLLAGEFAAQSPQAYAHFKALLLRQDPAIVTLEQPFLWPLVERLGQDGLLDGRRLIYSSQNWEAPLKDEILERRGVPLFHRRRIAVAIETMEAEICRHADLVLAVSEADAIRYRALVGAGIRVLVVPNGADRRTAPADWAERPCVAAFAGRQPLLFVGSAHLPNVEGFINLVAPHGLGFLPPGPSLAVCGSVSPGIFRAEAYQRHAAENEGRAAFHDSVSDEDLAALQQAARGTLLPIQIGGGSNLKTAEALVLGKWIVATTTAFRGFESFRSGSGVLIADTPEQFRAAMLQALNEEPPALDAAETARRDALHWDGCLRDSGYAEILTAPSWREEGV